MKLSRRSFLGKSLKALAIAAVAPIIPLSTKSITANPVPEDKGDVISLKSYSVGYPCKLPIPEIWSKKLLARFYENTAFNNFR